MAVINVLDKHTSELIAAGEVVERPASVIKELCENSIDASAKNICVTILRGGIELIEISDDGTGIDTQFVPTAFLRHATSKLKTESDLENIHTLGFRGEALASVASVSKIQITTRTQDAEFACLYRIEGGQEIGLEAAARAVGTTICVNNLFYNTPARMKFLKKDASECNFVSDVVAQLALSHPEISFKLIREGKVQFHTPGDNDLRSAAYEILGRDFAKDLVCINKSTGNYNATGLVTRPQMGRASRGMQYFFVNGRFVKNRTIMAALESAYRGMIMQGKFPGGILFLTMPFELVDVNVHPAKTEIRFAREKEVFDAIYSAVRSAIIEPSAAILDFDIKTTSAEIEKPRDLVENISAKQSSFTYDKTSIQTINYPKFNADSVDLLKSEPNLSYNTKYTENINVEYEMPSIKKEDIIPFENEDFNNKIIQSNTFLAQPLQSNDVLQSISEQTEIEQAVKDAPTLQYLGEAFNTYIITQQNNDLCFIDKHAAHERILYEELIKNYGNIDAQMLLEPINITLNAQEKNALLQNLDLLEKSGIELEDFGGMCVLVRSVPANIEHNNVEDLIIELANNFNDNKKNMRDEKTQWVLHSIACRAAVKSGDKQNSVQLIKLAQEILSGSVPLFCPHGRPVLLKITKKELEKQFGRQG